MVLARSTNTIISGSEIGTIHKRKPPRIACVYVNKKKCRRKPKSKLHGYRGSARSVHRAASQNEITFPETALEARQAWLERFFRLQRA